MLCALFFCVFLYFEGSFAYFTVFPSVFAPLLLFFPVFVSEVRWFGRGKSVSIGAALDGVWRLLHGCRCVRINALDPAPYVDLRMNVAFVGNNEIWCHCVPELLTWFLMISILLSVPLSRLVFSEEVVGLTMCRQCAVGATFTSARNCTPNEVLSIGTNMFQGAFERMTKDTTVTAPSTMKIKVVAPPDGNIFTVGAKRFRCAEVLPAEVFAFLPCLHRVTNSSERRFRLFNRWHALQFVLALLLAICSNTTVYVGVTIFALGGPVGVFRTFDRDCLLSASRVPVCRVATLVSTATAGRGPRCLLPVRRSIIPLLLRPTCRVHVDAL